MHRSVCNDNKGSRDHGKADNVVPISKGIEAKCTENRGARYFDVQAILVINQGEESDLVNDESFKPIMED